MRAAAALTLLIACGETCPQDLPVSCEHASSYEQVAPILASRCGACHAAGGEAESWPLDSEAAALHQRQEALNQVYGCRMPKAGELSPSERDALLSWLVCAAK